MPFSIFPFLLNRLRDTWIKPVMLSVPVVCVGNATAGGAGKTPVAIAVASLLKESKVAFAFISRGYKGRLHGPALVNPALHTADDVGDEPLLLARHGPCWIGKNRLATARRAIAAGAALLILDDGLQDPRLEKTLSLLVIDGAYGFGNRLLLPAGPLRDRKDLAFHKADAVVMIGKDAHNLLKDCPKTLPAFHATLRPASPENFTRQSYVAFAGIGQPKKFFDMLEALGATLAQTASFPDHHRYRKKDLVSLQHLAKKHGARLITTEKDAVRLPLDFREKTLTLQVSIAWKTPGSVRKLLKKLCQ